MNQVGSNNGSSATLATYAFMMPGSPSLVEGEASAVPQGCPPFAAPSRHGCTALHVQLRVQYPGQCVPSHKLAIHCNIHTNNGFNKHNSLRYGTDVHHQPGITHLCTTMPSPPQWVQPGTTPHGIATCMMVALCLGQGVRHQPMGAWSPQVDITVCTITAGNPST